MTICFSDIRIIERNELGEHKTITTVIREISFRLLFWLK
jgi:hypothetical protein